PSTRGGQLNDVACEYSWCAFEECHAVSALHSTESVVKQFPVGQETHVTVIMTNALAGASGLYGSHHFEKENGPGTKLPLSANLKLPTIYARISCTTCPCTSVRRKSRPL